MIVGVVQDEFLAAERGPGVFLLLNVELAQLHPSLRITHETDNIAISFDGWK